MSITFEELQRQAKALRGEEKAALARMLIEDLDATEDADAERLWLDEAQCRYEAYSRGELEARPGDEVLQRARDRLK